MERFFEENSTDKAVIYRMNRNVAHYHLPGLFEFIELYRVFLPLYREHREYFYDWCDIGSKIGRASCRKECRSRWSPYH